MTTATERKPRIAIVGGGPAGLSAAYHLTNDPDWSEKYHVTVYQLGWRLGGKGATGRARPRWRIEEHGIHIFGRFYFNTWDLMRGAYDAHPDDRAKLPVQTLEEAFLPSSLSYSVANIDGRWHAGTTHVPSTPGNPWDPHPIELSWRAVIEALIDILLQRGRATGMPLGSMDLWSTSEGVRVPAAALRAWRLDRTLRSAQPQLRLERTLGLTDDALAALLEATLRGLAPFRDWLHGRLSRLLVQFDYDLHQALVSLDLYWTVLYGIFRDGLFRSDTDLDVIDELDYRAWLEKHGASDYTLNSAQIFSIAGILFAYPDGDSTRPPRLSAASWLDWLLRSLLGRGHYFHYMAAGTGETAILPVYLSLVRRGVRFELFHKLEGIESEPDESDASRSRVTALHFCRQARPRDGVAYVPTVTMPKTDRQVWPNAPRWDLLLHGAENEAAGIDLEDWHGRSPIGAEPRTLTLGAADVDEGFEYVVWAIPPSLIPLVGDERMKRDHWPHVVEHMKTTATQASQVWLTEETRNLGWPIPKGDPPTTRYVGSTFPNPLSALCVFDDLLSAEDWPPDGPKGLIYWCGQLQPVGNAEAEDRVRIRTATAASLRLLGNFLRGARPEGTDRNDPQSIDFDYLHDEDDSNRGVARLGFHFVRANTDPIDAYVQANPSSARHGRLFPWPSSSGYSNLVPAGDWVYTGINVGSFEGAVTGGKLAAFALSGSPGLGDIHGFGFPHPDAVRAAETAIREGQVPIIR